MQDEEQLVLQLEDKTLTEPAQSEDRSSFRFGKRRGHRAEEEGAPEADRFQSLPDHPGLERGEIGHHVGKLGHGRELSYNHRSRRYFET
jgi:hypothetical protein